MLSKERLRIDEDRYLLGSSSSFRSCSRGCILMLTAQGFKTMRMVRAAQVRLNELMAVENLQVQFITSDTTIEVNHDLIYEKLLGKPWKEIPAC